VHSRNCSRILLQRRVKVRHFVRARLICVSSLCIANSDETNASSNANVLAPGRSPCMNCGTTATPLWRRDADGNPVCNACGEFFLSSFSLFHLFLRSLLKGPYQSQPRHTRGHRMPRLRIHRSAACSLIFPNHKFAFVFRLHHDCCAHLHLLCFPRLWLGTHRRHATSGWHRFTTNLPYQ
jgi:hypothetical protein